MQNTQAVSDKQEQLSEMDDEKLMKQLQDGVVKAFEILRDRYQGKLKSKVSDFGLDSNVVEDICQMTWIKVFRNRHSYRPIAKFSTWLFTIAINLARTEYSTRKRRGIQPLVTESRDGQEYRLPIPHPGRTPDETAEEQVIMERLRKALMEIPDIFREAVVLRDIQLLEYKEIAEITGCPLGTVKSRINRGRAKLQKRLEEEYDEVINTRTLNQQTASV